VMSTAEEHSPMSAINTPRLSNHQNQC
jgi:hypothetical protein